MTIPISTAADGFAQLRVPLPPALPPYGVGVQWVFLAKTPPCGQLLAALGL